jgi:hypothetical protein
MFHVVTTMNLDGWKATGKRMAESFVAKWPKSALPLTIYAEGFDVAMPGVEIRRLPAWQTEFKEKWRHTTSCNGMRGEGRYDYRWDAVKFSHKVGAVTDFGERLKDGVMIWLDSDVFTHAEITEEWLANLFPEPAYLAWLDRRYSHPECGFVMYRCSHPYHSIFMERYRELYISGELFGLPETNDCTALAWLVRAKVMNRKIPPPVSLSGGDPGWHHPFVNGPLGEKMDHMKGPRKQEGRSRQRDMRKQRSEAYWNG